MCPVECFVFQMLKSSFKHGQKVQKAYLWSSNDGNNKRTPCLHEQHQQGAKPVSGRIVHYSYSMICDEEMNTQVRGCSGFLQSMMKKIKWYKIFHQFFFLNEQALLMEKYS